MQYHEQALAIAREVKDRYLEAKALNNLANTVGLSQGDFSTARDYFEQAYFIFQELGYVSGKGLALTNLGWLTGLLGDYSASTAYHEQTLVISREIGNRSMEMYTYIKLECGCWRAGTCTGCAQVGAKALEVPTKTGYAGRQLGIFLSGLCLYIKCQTQWCSANVLKSIEIRLERISPL